MPADGPRRGRPRRVVSGALSLLIGASAATTALVGTATPASAGPLPACHFTGTDDEGVTAYTLHSNFTGVLSAFDSEGNWAHWYNLEAGDGHLQHVLTGDILRVYLDEPDGDLTLATPYVCSSDAPPAPSKTPQTISFDALPDLRVGATSPLSASVASGLEVEYAVDGPCSVVAGTTPLPYDVSADGEGECTVTATQPGDGTYAAADPVQRTFMIEPAPVDQTIAFAQPADMRLGDVAQQLDFSATSGLPVDLAVTDDSVCDLTPAGTVAAVAPGTCEITATQPGGELTDQLAYRPAPPVTRTFAVRPTLLGQSVTFPAVTNTRLGAAAPTLAATADSGLAVTYSSTTPDVCDVDGTSVTTTSVGTCTIAAGQGGGEKSVPDGDGGTRVVEYGPAPVQTRSFQVWPAPAAQSIDFARPADMRLGADPQVLTGSATSELHVTYTSQTPQICSVTNDEVIFTRSAARADSAGPAAVTPLAAGQCTITAAQEGNADWSWFEHVFTAAAPVTRTFTIFGDLAPQAIESARTNAAGVALSSGTTRRVFTSSVGLPVAVASTTPKVCSVRGDAVRLHQAGTCRLSATAAGTDRYLPAPELTVAFPVWGAPTLPRAVKAPGTIVVLGRGEEALRVTAGPADVCRVAGDKVAATGDGRCRVSVTTKGGRKVRSGVVRVHAPDAAKPADMDLVGSIRFDFRSAELDATAKRTLRRLAPRLRKAELVVVYGNTQAYGGGDTAANRELSARRARAVVKHLRSLRVEAKATTVAMASRNPAGRDESANRRADIYWIP